MKKIFYITILFTLIFNFYSHAQGNGKNVLLIIVDDLNTDEASFGNDAVITPHIDQLSQEGIRFTNVQTSYPVCGPSRASFLTGTYPETNGVINLKVQLREVSPDIVSLPQYLKHKGYITSAVGKVFDPRNVDDDHDGISWSVQYPNPSQYTYPAEYGSFVKGQYRVLADQSTEKGPTGVDDDGYVDGQIALDAINKLNSFKDQDKPFFLSVGFKKPHLPFIAPEKYWNLYNINNIEVTAYQQLPEGTNNIAFSTSGEFKNYLDIKAYLDGDQGKNDNFTSTVNGFEKVLDESKQKETILAYYAAISYIDAQIGKVVDALEKNGQKNNTIIILTSDHGFKLGDHNIWGKHNLLQNATQVPFIIIDPSRNSGVENRAVQLIDLFPSICRMLDLPLLEQFQGNSYFTDESAETTFPLGLAVSFYRHEGKKGYSFKKDRYRYTLWTKQTPMENTYDEVVAFAEELYEYPENNLHFIERKNLISDPAYQDILSNIKREVEKWWHAYNQNHKNHSDIDGILAVDDYNKLDDIENIYPNPAKEIINIKGNFNKDIYLKLYNLKGKTVSEKLNYINKTDRIELNIQNIESGIYILRINNKTFKLIVE
ncbi:MAG: hypothetical protein DSY82_09035 [Flavobacteriia bacterium]|nr:MAG: hypothetical protein DSY82_09035 [Flavobacteriia bacterium]